MWLRNATPVVVAAGVEVEADEADRVEVSSVAGLDTEAEATAELTGAVVVVVVVVGATVVVSVCPLVAAATVVVGFELVTGTAEVVVVEVVEVVDAAAPEVVSAGCNAPCLMIVANFPIRWELFVRALIWLIHANTHITTINTLNERMLKMETLQRTDELIVEMNSIVVSVCCSIR